MRDFRRNRPANLSGRSAAWLARLVRDQEVDGSNPFAPTTPKILPAQKSKPVSELLATSVLWRTRQCGPAKLAAVTTEAEAQGCTNFRHSERTELCDPPSQAILSHGHDIVQIYGTVRFHAIVLREENLGRHTANRGRDRRHSNSG